MISKGFFALFISLLFVSTSAFSQFSGVNVTGTSATLTDIFMVDSSVGYAGGVSGIFKTTDGGSHWTLQPNFTSQQMYFSGFDKIALSFLSSQIGYAAGWNSWGNYEEIMKTTDGGATWTVQHFINPNSQPYQSIEERLTDITVFDSNNAIAVGGMGRILKTTDGTNWVVKSSGVTSDLKCVAFRNQNVGIAAGSGILLTTADGGETWTNKALIYSILDIIYLSDTDLVASTAGGTIIRSSDAGSTWTESSFKMNSPLVKIAFVDSQIGFVVGGNVILKTTDGGQNFEKFYMNYNQYSSMDLRSVDALAENRFYVVTSRGELYSVFDQTVKFSPIAVFTASSTSTCDNSGQAINFSNKGRLDYQYQWLIDKQLNATTYDFSHEFTSAGNHKVSLVAYNGLAYDTSSVSVQVNSILPITNQITLYEPATDTIEFKAQQNYSTQFTVSNLQDGAYYQAFVNGNAISSKILAHYYDSSIPFTIPDAAVAGTYQYTVKAEYSSQCGVATAQKSFTRVLLDIPFGPKYLTVSNTVNSSAYLQWTDMSVQETQYQVERRAEGAAQFDVIATISGVSYSGYGVSYTDQGLEDNKRYYYRVAALNAAGLSKYSNTVSVLTHGSIIYVNPKATGINDGSSWQNALTDIAQALNESTLDDEVWLMKGTYTPDPAKPWVAKSTKGVFGGFNGTETQRDQRNWKLNKTILSGEIGKIGDLTDNINNVITVGTLGAGTGCLSGVTISYAKGRGATVGGLVSDCVIEFNNVGLAAWSIDKCIVRNNTTGINGNTTITNSFIYNNVKYGITGDGAKINISNCLFYSNPLGSIAAGDQFFNYPTVTAYNTIFGFKENDTQINVWRDYVNLTRCAISNETSKSFAYSYAFIGNYHMNYISGDDGILGNDDDLLYFPEPLYHNWGFRNMWYPYDFPYFTSSDQDFFHNPRIRDNLDNRLDIGPAEFLPDTIKVPKIKATRSATGEAIRIHLPKFQPGVTRIWLERTEPTKESVFIPLAPTDTVYVDTNIKFWAEYFYSIRLQKGKTVSFPGKEVYVRNYPKATLTAAQLNNAYNVIKYSYTETYPVQSAYLMAATGTPNNFQYIGNMLPISNQVSTFWDYAPGQTRYYCMMTTFNGVFTLSDTVKVTTLPNHAPEITGQRDASVIQGSSYIFTYEDIQFHDDYNFPQSYTIQMLPGEHYTFTTYKPYDYIINSFLITPEAGYQGDIHVNVTVSDMDLSSNVFPFLLKVQLNDKPVIVGQNTVKIVQGDKYKILPENITATDDYNFPSGMTLEVLPDANYTITANDSIVTNNDFTGLAQISVHVSDGYQFSDIYKFQITVVPRIEGSFTATETDIRPNTAIDFSSTYTGTPTAWHWQFEGAVPATSEDPNPKQISYPTSGTFKVQLVMEDELQKVTVLKNKFITVQVISSVEENLDGNITVYPNPSTGEFYISSGSKTIDYKSIKVVDFLGKEIQASISEECVNKARIKLTPGEYIVSFTVANECIHKKVLIY